ncbi:MAG: biotin synthase BioB [Proteobacteria bacterium]|nr:biotin synthase BioB [Pseudomonadota bacterium]
MTMSDTATLSAPEAPVQAPAAKAVRNDWSREEIAALFDLPFTELVFRAAEVHRTHHRAGEVQLCTLLSIKTGGCPEDCGYCSQSVKADSGVEATKLMEVQAVLQSAAQARDAGSKRFCMGAAWRNPKARDMPAIIEMVKGVRQMGMETCMTLGMLDEAQAAQLAEAGLDYYNHNIDTSERFYSEIITTRSFQDRIDTLGRVRAAGIRVCCGGIVGLGEKREDRGEMLRSLANFDEHPESVPINLLIRIPGTPLAPNEPSDPFEFVRTVAVARTLMPKSVVRLSAGREQMSDEMQALCFFAGANSMFVGEKLLTAKNPAPEHDRKLFERLGLKPLEMKAL